MFSFCYFRVPEYEPNYSQNFDTAEYFAVCGANTYSIFLALKVCCNLHYLNCFLHFATITTIET